MNLSIAEYHDPPDLDCHPNAPKWAEAVQVTYRNLGQAEALGLVLRLQNFFVTDTQFSREVGARLCLIVEQSFLDYERVLRDDMDTHVESAA